MSFLVQEEEDVATLEEAFAFIDACDGSAVDASGSSSESGSGSGGSPVAGVSVDPAVVDAANDDSLSELPLLADEPQPELGVLAKTKKKKKQRTPGASTRLQRRKKAELVALREQALKLEAYLAQLKRAKNVPGEESSDSNPDLVRNDVSSRLGVGAGKPDAQPQSAWFNRALEQYRERLKSEETNRSLRGILANQARVNSSLRGAVGRRSALAGMDLVFHNKPLSALHPLAQTDNSGPVIAELEKMVSEMYLDSSSVLPTETPPSLSSSMLTKHDRRRGKMAEIVTTTPMDCSMASTSNALWKSLNTHRDYVDKMFRFVRVSKPDTLEKNYVLTLRGPVSVMQANGMQFIRRFEEPNRVVLVRSSLLLLPTEGLQFRDQAWITITRSENDPEHASVVRTLLQLYMDYKDGLSARSEDLNAAQEFMLSTLSTRLREYQEVLQNSLLEKAGRASLSPVPVA